MNDLVPSGSADDLLIDYVCDEMLHETRNKILEGAKKYIVTKQFRRPTGEFLTRCELSVVDERPESEEIL